MCTLSLAQIGDKTITVRLRTANWYELIQREMSLNRPNTEAMYNATTNSLLGEDFSIPSMAYDMEGDMDDEDDEVATLNLPRSSSQRSLSPAASPAGSGE